jgi:hypothetical protein
VWSVSPVWSVGVVMGFLPLVPARRAGWCPVVSRTCRGGLSVWERVWREPSVVHRMQPAPAELCRIGSDASTEGGRVVNNW